MEILQEMVPAQAPAPAAPAPVFPPGPGGASKTFADGKTGIDISGHASTSECFRYALMRGVFLAHAVSQGRKKRTRLLHVLYLCLRRCAGCRASVRPLSPSDPVLLFGLVFRNSNES